MKLGLTSLGTQFLSCILLQLVSARVSIKGAGWSNQASSGKAVDMQVESLATDTAESAKIADKEWMMSNHAGHARWLVHEADYAVFSTHSTMQEGWPFSNVVSISDGAPGNSTGRIIVYVATISQFAADVQADPKVSLGVSQAQADGGTGCQYVDAEWPLCARANVFGYARLVPEAGEADAAEIMFARHPLMRAWAALAHEWAFYEIHITNVRVLDFFGGFHKVTKEEYFAARPAEPLAAPP